MLQAMECGKVMEGGGYIFPLLHTSFTVEKNTPPPFLLMGETHAESHAPSPIISGLASWVASHVQFERISWSSHPVRPNQK